MLEDLIKQLAKAEYKLNLKREWCSAFIDKLPSPDTTQNNTIELRDLDKALLKKALLISDLRQIIESTASRINNYDETEVGEFIDSGGLWQILDLTDVSNSLWSQLETIKQKRAWITPFNDDNDDETGGDGSNKEAFAFKSSHKIPILRMVIHNGCVSLIAYITSRPEEHGLHCENTLMGTKLQILNKIQICKGTLIITNFANQVKVLGGFIPSLLYFDYETRLSSALG